MRQLEDPGPAAYAVRFLPERLAVTNDPLSSPITLFQVSISSEQLKDYRKK